MPSLLHTIAILAFIALTPLTAYADCGSPSGKAGNVIFNAPTKTMQYCNGTNWVNTGAVMPTAPQTGCVSPTGIAGGVIYNGALGTVQFCNGSSWINTACPSDRQPNGSGCTGPTGKAGAILFENNSKEMQFCDSTKWVAMGWPCGTGTGLFKLKPTDASTNQNFGKSVAIDNDTLVVSAYADGTLGLEAGAVYVYVRSGTNWTLQQKLYASDGAAGDLFGNSVGISSNTIVVGSSNDDTTVTNGGSAYIFVRSGTTWTQQAKLIPSDTAANDYAGTVVTINSNTVVVGSWQKSSETGAAYVFTRSGTTWTQQAKITGSPATTFDRFAFSLALESNTLVVGASHRDAVTTNDEVGSVYVFTRTGTTWTQRARLMPAGNPASAFFGRSVAISNTMLLGGATGNDMVYYFTGAGTTWTQQQAFAGSDTGLSNSFGESLALLNDTLLVGDIDEDESASNSGAVYQFKLSGGTWTQSRKLKAPDPTANDNYGNDLAIASGLAIIGMKYDDDNGSSSGSVFIVPIQ